MKILKSLKKQQIGVFFKKNDDFLNEFNVSTRVTGHREKLGFGARKHVFLKISHVFTEMSFMPRYTHHKILKFQPKRLFLSQTFQCELN